MGAVDRVEAGEQQLAAVGVHDAVGERGRQAADDNRLSVSDQHQTPLRVQLVDPSAFTPPYDRALAAALSQRGAEVELVTTRFLYGEAPAADGYAVDERFYRRSAERGLAARGRLGLKLVEHLRDM